MMSAARLVGVEPVVVSLSEGPFVDELRERGDRVFCLGLDPSPSFAGGVLSKARGVMAMRAYRKRVTERLGKVLRELSPGAVHLAWPHLVFSSGPAVADLGLPCFWEMPNIVGRTLPFGLNAKLYRRACRKWGIRPVANSRFTAATVSGPGVEPAVVYPPTDTAWFVPREDRLAQRRELGYGSDDVVVGIVARMSASKGQREVARAVGLLKDRWPGLRLLLVGGPVDDVYAEQIRSEAEAGGYADRIRMIDRVSDPRRLLGSVDLAVNARVDPEPFGLSVVEAMSMELPVLAHALGGPAETVADGETGWHVSGVTGEVMAEGLMRAMGDRDRWSVMGKAARRRAVKLFSVEAAARELSSLWGLSAARN